MRKPLILPLLALSSLLAMGVSIKEFNKVDAAYDTKNVVSEQFDGELDESWELVGNTSIEKQYSSMRLKPKAYDWGTSLALNQRLSGDFTVKMELTTLKMGGWFGVAFAGVSSSAYFSSCQGGLVFFDIKTSTLGTTSGELAVVDDFELPVFSSNLKTKRQVVIEVDDVGNNHSRMSVSVYENEQFIGNVLTNYEFNNLDGYMLFNSNRKDVEIFNIEILNGSGERLYYDDFSTSKVLYPTSGSIDSEWYSNGFSEEELKVGYINYLSLNQVGDGIVYQKPLDKVNDPDLDVVYHFYSEISYSMMDFGGESGFEIGKKDKDSHGYFFGIRRLALGYSIVTYKYGESNEVVVNSSNEDYLLRMPLELNVHTNGDIDIIAGDISQTVRVTDYDGYYGLFNYDHLNESQTGKGMNIFSFKMDKTNYYDRSSGDIYMNFNGTKKTYFEDIDEYTYDYFISRREWNIGTNVSASKWKNKDQGNGKLEFQMATGTSLFGPKVMYKDFVVKFDVEITSETVPYGGVVGLEFGNSRSGLLYENTKSLGVAYYTGENHEYMTVSFATNMEYADEDDRYCTDEQGNKDIFKSNGKFTLMYICQNNTVSMHYLLDGEDESTLAKTRCVVSCKENESTDGYLAIYGANGISFTVDNLSIINLDYATKADGYKGQSDYQEVTRVDFSKKDTIKGIEYQNASITDGRIRMNNEGLIKTDKFVNDGILRLNISDIEDTLDIKLDSLTIKLVNKNNNKSVVVADALGTRTYPLASSFDFRQSLVELEKLGNQLFIRLKDRTTPLSSINKNEIVATINGNISDKLIIQAKGGFVSLNDLTFVNLNKYVTIANRDYNPDTDSFEPWNPKPPRDGGDKKKNNNLVIIIPIVIGSVVLITAAVVVTILIVRRRKAHA